MNIIKKLFSLSNDDNCAIGLCHFTTKEDLIKNEESPKRKIKETTLSQMLKRPI